MVTLAVGLPNYAAEDPGSWTHLLDVARAADAAGIDRVLVSDHVVFGENLEEYGRPEVGGTAGGVQPTGPDGLWLEPLTTLSVVCGATTQVRLMTCVLQAALRRPVVLAKSLATLDVLSGGRVDLGVGVGWQREEYEAAGLDFSSRGRHLDDTLAVCKTLWRERVASHSSEFLKFDSIHCMPKPVQEGGVPVWVSGTVNPAVLQRIVRFGAGWVLWGPSISDPRPGVDQIRAALDRSGRDPGELRVLGSLEVKRDHGGTVDLVATMAAVPDLVGVGVTDLRVSLPVPAGLDRATEFLQKARACFREAGS